MRTFSFILLSLAILFTDRLNGQDAESIIKSATESWEALSNHIDIKRTAGSAEITGKASFDGEDFELKASIEDKKLKMLSLIMPESAALSTSMIDKLAGSGTGSLVPAGLDASLKLDRLEFEFSNNKVSSAGIIFKGSTWAPFQGQDLKLNEVSAKIVILDPLSAVKSVFIDISGQVNLPGEVASYLELAETTLEVSGAVNTKTKKMSLTAKINSTIPLGPQKVLFFKESFLELYIEGGKPGLCIGGQLELRPPNESPKLLNGEVSIDLTGSIFAQAWMDGAWHNPFGISKDVYIYDPGFGIGVDISKTPFPLPILGVQGGLSIGSPDPKKARFGGKVTVGLHAGDPTQNMIDAQDINANLYDIINTFYPQGIPQHLSQFLKKTKIKNARLTIVPPGNGVELFGNQYDPGINASGVFSVGNHSGAILLSINENEIQAYGGLSPISYKGFSLTSSDGQSGPEAYLLVPAGSPSKGVFGIDGKIKLLGIETSANIYLSDQGFNLTASGKILDAFEANLDVAGKDIFTGGSVYVHANLKNDLFTKINEVAADEIGKVAKKTNDDFEAAKKGLEANRPKLNAAKSSYEAEKKKVMEKNTKECDKKKSLDAQKAVKEQEKKNINAKIKALDAQIVSLKSKIASAHKRATYVKNTKCPSGSFYDPRNGGECWSCPTGTNRTAYAVYTTKACSKPAYEKFAKATYRGKPTGLSCPSGQFYDPRNFGECWSIPSGYKRTAYAVTDSRAASKLVPEKLSSATKVKSCACTGSSFFDPRNGGECWSCPVGTKRTAYAVTDSRACVSNSYEQWNLDLAAKESEKAALITDREVRVKAIGNLVQSITQAMEDGCKMVANSELANLDPAVAPKLAEYESLNVTVNGFQSALDGLNALSQGTLKAAEYVARNGGSAAGIVNITKASFTTCLSTAADGKVALKVQGTYANQPLNVSFDFNIPNPENAIKLFADQLMATNSASSKLTYKTCSRPIVPKPSLDNTQIQELKNAAKLNKPNNSAVPKIAERPDWAGKERFKEGNFEQQLRAALNNQKTDDIVRCASFNLNMDIKSKTGATPLLIVAKNEGLSKVIYLIDHGASAKSNGFIQMSDKHKIGSIVGIAAYKGDMDMLRYAIQNIGLSPDELGPLSTGVTPLGWALLNKKSDCVRYLLNKGAKPTTNSSAISLAANNNDLPIVKELIEKGYNANNVDLDGDRAIHHAIRHRNLEMLNLLLDNLANANSKNRGGMAPILMAAKTGQADICKALWKAGANLEVTYDKKNARKWATKGGYKELAKWLKKPY